MNKYWTKNKIIFIFVVALIAVAIPFIINYAYKVGGYITVWTGSELLMFYGNILTAVAAVLGVYYTLDYSKFKQMEYEKMRVKPYLNINHSAETVSLNNIFKVNPNEVYVYKNFADKKYIETGVGCLPNELYKINISNDKDRISSLLKNSIFLKFNIINIGLDSAINMKIKLNDDTIIHNLNLLAKTPMAIKILIVSDEKFKMNDKIELEDMEVKITYENIYRNQIYEQSGYIKKFAFEKNTKMHSYTEEMDGEVSLFSKQIEVAK